MNFVFWQSPRKDLLSGPGATLTLGDGAKTKISVREAKVEGVFMEAVVRTRLGFPWPWDRLHVLQGLRELPSG